MSPIFEEYDPERGFVGSVGAVRESVEGLEGVDGEGKRGEMEGENGERWKVEEEAEGWSGYVRYRESCERSSIRREAKRV